MNDQDANLCHCVFEAVRQSSPIRQCSAGAWRGPSDDAWIGSDELDTGGRRLGSLPIRNWLLLAPEREFANWSDLLVDRLFGPRLPPEGKDDWGRQRSFLQEYVFRQFFRQGSDLPALVWATPLWFLNTSAFTLPAKAKVIDKPGRLEKIGSRSVRNSGVEIRLGKDRTLVFPVRRSHFHYERAQEQDNQSRCQLVKNKTRSREIKIRGQDKLFITEDVLSQACLSGPLDAPVLQSGKLPVHWSFYRVGPTGPFLNEVVLTLALVIPMDNSRRHAWVDHLTLFLSRQDARCHEICATTGWDFGSFVALHPGLGLALKKKVALGGGNF